MYVESGPVGRTSGGHAAATKRGATRGGCEPTRLFGAAAVVLVKRIASDSRPAAWSRERSARISTSRRASRHHRTHVWRRRGAVTQHAPAAGGHSIGRRV